NSGVITSQILRGIAEGLAGKARFNALDLANALDAGTRAAYGAVAKPVEGTILTVIREASVAAVQTAEENRDLETVLGATVEAAHDAVAKTPTLLAILRDAGVVDSGGEGLYRLMHGALQYTLGTTGRAARGGATRGRGAPASVLVAHADEGFGYETMFLLQARPGASLDVDAIRSHLESIGDSVLVAGDAAAVKVHVHGEHPDAAIGYGLSLGSLSRISVENLDHQTRDVRETRAAAFTAERSATVGSSAAIGAGAAASASSIERADADSPNGRDGSTSAGDLLPLAVVAVAAGEGLAAIFRDFGVQQVILGGQAANPSTGELLAAVRAVPAREILVLPNNPNVVLAARQVADLADRPVAVVATRNAAEGFAALLALDPTKGAADNAPQMTAAGRSVQSLSVTAATRDATIGGRPVKAGQWIVLDPDDGLIGCDDDPTAASLAGIRALTPGFELVTLYYGADADLASTEALARRVREVAPAAEVEVVHGGQPHYRYLISAE
ncbi:MAG TPA: DAK2 domain-containing protein, partial [Candidatus Limnocylindrales bacterium]|nr:DAK2 domain-containing protein [Candidatus Limnocylindrales bacterium]